jgi:hypothetical protein
VCLFWMDGECDQKAYFSWVEWWFDGKNAFS